MGFRIASAAALVVFSGTSALASTINGDYAFTIVQQTRSLAQNASYGNSVILSDGSVVSTVAFNGNSGNDRIEVVSPDGNKRLVDLNGLTVSAQTPLSANDKGQIVTAAFDERERKRLLILIEPNNEVKTLISSPAIQPTGVADESLDSFVDIEINENGEIVASGSARTAAGSGISRIIKISDTSGSSPQIQVLDEADRDARIEVAFDVAIDDSGTVMWNRQNGNANEVVLSDGQSERVGLSSESPISAQRFQYEASALTNSGLLGVGATLGSGTTSAVGTSDITNGLTDEDFDPAFSVPVPAQLVNVDVNEFGQVMGILDRNSPFGASLDGETIIAPGDKVGEFTLGRAPNFDGFLRNTEGQFLNDAGQFTFEAFGTLQDGNSLGLDAGNYNLVVRADPIGAIPELAILPDTVVDGVSKVSFELVNGLGVDASSPIYVDPVFGEGLSYSITNGGPIFNSIIVPTQDLGGLSMFDVVFDGITQTIGFGETIDFSEFFAGGISSFEIFGHGGATSFNSDFVAGFTFSSQGSVAFDISSASQSIAPVPLPASLPLLLVGLTGLGLMARRRRNS